MNTTLIYIGVTVNLLIMVIAYLYVLNYKGDIHVFNTDCTKGIALFNRVEIHFYKYGVKLFINRR